MIDDLSGDWGLANAPFDWRLRYWRLNDPGEMTIGDWWPPD
jgi:hypothetical protein